jgi:hypothetical protein
MDYIIPKIISMNFKRKLSSYILSCILIMVSLCGCKKEKKDPIHEIPKFLDYKAIRTVATFTIEGKGYYQNTNSGVLISTSAGVNCSHYEMTTIREKTEQEKYWQKGLIPDTRYYARYYIITDGDTVYSNEVSFFTASEILYDNITLSTNQHYYSDIRAGENLLVTPSSYISSHNFDLYMKSLEIYINDVLYERPTFQNTQHESFGYITTPRYDGYPILLPCDYAAGTYKIKAILDGVPSQELSVQVDAFVPYNNPSSISILDRTLVYGSETVTLQNFSIDDKRSTIGISVGGIIFPISGDDYIYLPYLQELGRGQKEVKLILECGELSLGTIEIL